MDFTVNLNSLGFECGLSEYEKEFIFLRARATGLTVCGCVHAAFLCKLAYSLSIGLPRQIEDIDMVLLPSNVSKKGKGLTVGVLGGGHIGKQLVQVLLEKNGLKPSQINISSRRPETLEEFVKRGIMCYFDNQRLVAWADVLFLCCLPSHLPKVCAELQSHIPKHCLVYSFLSAVPLNRLAQLLGHSFILKPQYEFVACDSVNMWLSRGHVTVALKDPKVIDASCPLAMRGGLCLDPKWLFGLLYSLLNMCTAANVGSTEALGLINELFQLKGPGTVAFILNNFVNSSYASSLTPDESFPWINLVDVQAKETPLSCFISRNNSMQGCLSALYNSVMVDPLKGKKETGKPKDGTLSVITPSHCKKSDFV
ncbi:NADP-dependent oxidoreductase domain-containing protein 1 isoform X1 [Salmo salar]|uniref:NADP-dependent oxidoreductase domain-containing protein 1 n=2 Tax=Salmo salar TaxID=8030 RepID=A0A1S3QH05_SALSA|nr:NADP-dependent oxidoreductase domain-containing protein 1 isoform X1 [Salmo salar]|eukprot:XP_014039305.1 PREDICTED: NADP-dependent oxidoreductase domain-containing protein 1 isoform X1 [Salmo salar]